MLHWLVHAVPVVLGNAAAVVACGCLAPCTPGLFESQSSGHLNVAACTLLCTFGPVLLFGWQPSWHPACFVAGHKPWHGSHDDSSMYHTLGVLNSVGMQMHPAVVCGARLAGDRSPLRRVWCASLIHSQASYCCADADASLV
jgi:hypothetical protein